MAPATRAISIDVACRDVLMFRADVLALKHAGGLHGADRDVVGALEAAGITVKEMLPVDGDFHLVRPDGAVPFDLVLFIGTADLRRFGVADIRSFSRRVLSLLALHAPLTRHLALTLHGTGTGLNEPDALRSEVMGLLDAVAAGEHPETLERITIVEHSRTRAARLTELLSSLTLQLSRTL